MPGVWRAEKGADHWSQIVGDLKADYFATGRLQLALQTRLPEDLPEPLRGLSAELASSGDASGPRTPVVHAAWPLSPPDYLRLLADSDIGLLMYDPLPYNIRCSGVLVEMLSAGIPVVVPAGCWLADQIAEPIYAYQEQLGEKLPNLPAARLEWKIPRDNRSERGLRVGTDAPGAKFPAAVALAAVPAHASHLLLAIKRDAPNVWNYYCSVSVLQRDAEGNATRQSRDIIGYRVDGRWMTVLVPLDSHSRQLEIRLQTAFGHEPFLLDEMKCSFLAASDMAPLALGAVGRLATDPKQAAECLRDIVDHYDHYNKTARAFAAEWAPVHTADEVLRALTNRSAVRAAGRREMVRQEQAI